MGHTSPRGLILALLFSGIAALASPVSASEPPAAVGRALAAVFGEDHLQDAAFFLRERAAAMSPEDRLEFLANWVLPGPSHVTFRLPMSFTQAGPVNRGAGGLESADLSGDTSTRVNAGGELISPALDLVSTAAQLGVLSELKERIEKSPADNSLAQRCRLTLIILCNLADGDITAAEEHFAQMHASVLTLNRSQLRPRCPETLAIYVATQNPQTRGIAQELLTHLLDSWVWAQRTGSLEAWDRQMSALGGWSFKDPPTPTTAAELTGVQTNWIPVSRMTAQSRGSGFPEARWKISQGRVRNLASHDEDYLYYRIPLRGDFQVECEVTLDGWQQSHLSVAGLWVAPVWGLASYQSGIFRQHRALTSIDPPLTKLHEWIRVRMVVRDGSMTTYFNGRPVHVEPLAADHEPWIAIRSPWYLHGAVKDLRITGQPTIPEELHLCTLPELTGWFSYYNTYIENDWRHSRIDSDDLITGVKHTDNAGTAQESLLQYNRPMLEDGTIVYDFFYDEGRVHVHPSLDRQAFLLEPGGVRIHDITDGAWDTTGTDPMNVHDEPGFRRGPGRLPLIANDWNRLKLNLACDTVQLTLNDELVFERNLERTNLRTFGLFHYSDQTEAKVRNVVWRGNWPKSLPAEEFQELADPDSTFPTPALKDVFRHDFTKSGMPKILFSAGGIDGVQNQVSVSVNGLKMRSESIDAFNHGFVFPNLQVHGDFDIIAVFDQLETTVSENGAGGISLDIVLADEMQTDCSVYRGFVRRPGTEDLQTAHLYISQTKVSGARPVWLGNIAEESQSGRLRLLRRGRTLYSLFAEGDSSHFRLVSAEEFPEDGVISGGVRLHAKGAASETQVVWKNIEIHAAELSGPAMDDH